MDGIFGFDREELTFSAVLAAKALRNGDRIFLHNLHDGQTFSFRELDAISSRIANGFLAAGIAKGDHIAVMMENSPEQIFTYCALGKIGAVFVPLNPAARGRFLQYYLDHSDSIAVVVDGHLVDLIRQIGSDIPRVGRLFVLADPDGGGRSAATGCIAETNFAALLEHDTAPPEIETRFSDLCSIMYTSGTTGPSKGNMFSQAHTLTFGVAQRRALGISASDIFYVSLPLFHAAGWNTFTLSSLLDDAAIVLPRAFSTSRFWEEIRTSGSTVTSIAGVVNFLMAQPPSERDRDHPLRLCIASPMPANADEVEQRFGIRLASAYGLSDYCIPLAFPTDAPIAKRGSCGRPVEGAEIRIVDDDDFDLPVGAAGELLIRANIPWASTSGYYRMPEATTESRRNLWFHTGDRASVDADGYVFFLDRKKDAIRRRGENISAFEVENAISSHPSIAEIAIFPVRWAEGSEDEVAASVVLREGCGLSHEEFVDYCASALPYFMVPRYIEFRETLPRTLTQKVQKAALRSEMEADLSSVWDREEHGLVLKRRKR